MCYTENMENQPPSQAIVPPPSMQIRKNKKRFIVLSIIVLFVLVIGIAAIAGYKKESVSTSQNLQDYYALDGKPLGTGFYVGKPSPVVMSIVHYYNQSRDILVSDVLTQAKKDLGKDLGNALRPFAFLPEFGKLYFVSSDMGSSDEVLFGYDLQARLFFPSKLQSYLNDSISHTTLVFSSNRRYVLFPRGESKLYKKYLTGLPLVAWDLSDDSVKRVVSSSGSGLHLLPEFDLTAFYWLDNHTIAITVSSSIDKKTLSYAWDVETDSVQPRKEFGIIDNETSPKLAQIDEVGNLTILISDLRTVCNFKKDATLYLYPNKYFGSPHTVVIAANLEENPCLYNQEHGVFHPKKSPNKLADSPSSDFGITNEVIDSPISFAVDSSDGKQYDKLYLLRIYDGKIAHIILKNSYLKSQCSTWNTCSFAAWMVDSSTIQYQAYDASRKFIETRQVVIPDTVFE
ncbi:MAG: hypothetical protein A3B13_00630 [Candidatus Liptonbacteria bacterium RIFCSPLOWO2_01_FULL_45_15]|uniref:Uncharacterized protein n=1 Tax=Candidatus Liptonbacteria bacterium RIFCSPLOWO2_01_FULL_45_15 TaxID=1798649 RepID=A0A1G2CCU6_9BACT|nr:MAG: hypothetical protein A3B13_00630 [Candidatus Liptonbacteria bacterium RIFCSPLOWO2_01_FULL_45_15]